MNRTMNFHHLGRAALLSLLALAACGGNKNGSGGPSPTDLVLAKGTPPGDAQTATVGHALPEPFQVVVSRAGVPEADVIVAWNTTAAGAVLEPASSVTDGNGAASTHLTLGQGAGVERVNATVAGAGSLSFTATGLPDAPSALTLVTGGTVSGPVNTTFGQPLQARVADQFGNSIPGVAVNWQVLNGAATLSPTATVTSATGIASTRLTFGNTPGAIQIAASSPGLAGSPATLGATATVAPRIVTVQLLESGGNRFNPTLVTIAPGTTVHFDWVGGFHDVTSTGTPGFTGSGGTFLPPHSYDVTFNTAGTYKYFCTEHGTPTSGMRGSIVVQ